MEKVRTFIKAHRLLDDGAKVFVAVSGGADSVALLVMLSRMGYRCTALHCNFHLRGAESDRDTAFVVGLCEKLDIPLLVKHFDVKERMEATGESVEMACRELRYDWFRSVLADNPGSRLAVAHHQGDNVETFFLNAMRGAGVAGLKGMLPANGDIVRPLLEITRSEIEEYLESEGIGFVTDSTNRENTFKRNRLRNLILPVLEENFPGAAAGISKSMAHLRDDLTLLSDYEAQLRDRYTDPDGTIDVAAIVDTHPHPREVLYRLLRDTDVTTAQLDTIIARPEAAGLTFGPYTLDRGLLRPIIDTGFATLDVTPGDPPLLMRHITRSEFRPFREPYTIWLDAAALDGNPRWQLRQWRRGDRFKPFGMKGSKKLSDLFAQHRLDDNAKRAVRILTRNDEIIWVAGLRPSRLFAVTPATTDIIELTLKL